MRIVEVYKQDEPMYCDCMCAYALQKDPSAPGYAHAADTGAATSWEGDTDCQPGCTYHVIVRARTREGLTSEWSAPLIFTVRPTTPASP